MSIKSSLLKRVTNEVRAKFARIDVIPKQGLFNHKCFHNAVEFAYNNEGYHVVEVMQIDNGASVLHYVNCKFGIFYETTLGHLAEGREYYFIRVINEKDYPFIEWEFTNSKKTWNNKYLKWYHKLIKINRIV